MPDARNSTPSSGSATPNQSAPSFASLRAHSTAPCPYAFALMTAITRAAGLTRSLIFLKFAARLLRSISAHVGRRAWWLSKLDMPFQFSILCVTFVFYVYTKNTERTHEIFHYAVARGCMRFPSIQRQLAQRSHEPPFRDRQR